MFRQPAHSVLRAIAQALQFQYIQNHIYLFRFNKAKSAKHTKRYPHSSLRQRARYARQLANNQLHFTDGSHWLPET